LHAGVQVQVRGLQPDQLADGLCKTGVTEQGIKGRGFRRGLWLGCSDIGSERIRFFCEKPWLRGGVSEKENKFSFSLNFYRRRTSLSASVLVLSLFELVLV